MVLNLLQRFTLDEARELILKTFGYFSSSDRVTPLMKELEFYEEKINLAKNFKCPFNHNVNDLNEFIKCKNMFVEARTISKSLLKQKGKKSNEAIAFTQRAKALRRDMEKFGCNNCKIYQKHKKELDIIARYEKKIKALKKEIDFQKDIYWKKFLAHKNILAKTGYLKDDYPTEKGKTCMAIRGENELYISEIILRKLLDNLNPIELASVICSVTTEEARNHDEFMWAPPSKPVRQILGKVKDIRREINYLEREENVENVMNLNSQFSSLIEFWVDENIKDDTKSTTTWENMFEGDEISQGDVVRAFKRTVDMLRQLTILENVPLNLKENAKIAMSAINKEPVNIE